MSIIKSKIALLRQIDSRGEDYIVYPRILIKNIIDKSGGNTEEIIKSILTEDAIERYASKDHSHTVSLDDMTESFKKVFPYLGDVYFDPNAMTLADILMAINTVWEGESSSDYNAMSATDISNAINMEWNGKESTDDRAIKSDTISDIITKTSI